MNIVKQELIDFLLKYGKPKSWKKTYDKFPYLGRGISNKQKSDNVRSLYRTLMKNTPTVDNYENQLWVGTSEKECIEIGKKEKEDGLLFYKEVDGVDPVKSEGHIYSQAKEDGMYLILGCLHLPFINKFFWNALLELVKDHRNNIKGVIYNGDVLDINSLSSHDKGKMPLPGVSLGWEYEESNKYLKSLEEVLNPNVYKAYMYGNHEERFLRYMATPDHKKLQGALQAPEEALNLKDRGYDIYTNWKYDELTLGDLTIIHGEFFSVHLCKRYLDIFKKNILFAHSHRVQIYKEGKHAAFNIGGMFDMDSLVFSYATRAMKKTWSNAFAVATLYQGKTNVEIVNWNEDHLIYGGKIYK